MDLDAFFATVQGFLDGPWGIPIRIAAILVISVLLRVVLQFVIRRVVNRVVTGVKKKQNVDDTQALQHSPIHAARIVQRTRALGGVLNSVVTTVVVISAEHNSHNCARVQSFGANTFLAKPVDDAELIHAVTAAMRAQEQGR